MCNFLYRLEEIIEDRIRSKDPSSYTYRLYQEGLEKICKKIGEEAFEVVLAALTNNRDQVIYEVADLTYHVLVLLKVLNLNFKQVCIELERRHLERAR
ncbi:MAG: phosphoribosyl-ATP diphosphatase [Thermoprotei archaeon ex4572_64]|nr:MAG: phosphoribosyl-ATP diphosphatase [Thermoprotei archaeon ex4572_64]